MHAVELDPPSFPRGRGRLRRWRRRPAVRLLQAAFLVGVLGAAVAQWQVLEWQQALVESTARHHAEAYARVLAALRSAALPLADAAGPPAAGAADRAAWHVRIQSALAEQLAQAGGGPRIALHGSHRADRPVDPFAREAWQRLTRDPDTPVQRVETRAEGRVLRYAVAERLAPGCTGCHNGLDAAPDRDWQAGDLIGVLEVTYPLEAVRADAAPATGRVLAPVVLAGALILWLVLASQRRTAAELEGRVEERTLALRGALARAEHTEQALRDSERRARDLVEVSSDWLWELDAQLRLSFVSRQIETVTGFEPEAAVGKTRWELAGADPASDEIWARHKADLEARRAFRNFRYCARTPNGRTCHVRLNGKPIFDARGAFLGYVGSGTDETAEVEARVRAESAEAMLRSITSQIPGVVFRCVLDPDGRAHYPFISGGTQEMLGYATDELMANPQALFRATLGEDMNRYYAAVQRSACQGTRLDIEYRIIGRAGHWKWVHEAAHPQHLPDGSIVWDGVMLDITAQKQAEEHLRILTHALESAAECVVLTDRSGTIAWVNHAFTKLTGYSREEAVGRKPSLLKSGCQSPEFYAQLWRTVGTGEVWSGELVNRRKDGGLYTEHMTITPVSDESGAIQHFIAVKHDVTERRQLEAQLLQAHKLESIGQLAAGIAHEINTPTQYVGDNARFLQEAFEDLLGLQPVCTRLLACARQGGVDPALVAEVDAALAAADLDYLREEVPKALEQALDGVGRITKIVSAMKDFSHPGSEDKQPVDLNRVVETTLTVARNEWKYVAETRTELDPDLPEVPGYRAELGQVVLNIVVNAAQAIGEQMGAAGRAKGTITIATRRRGDAVELRISDDGPGMPPAVRDRVFEPFFTTKDVGKGTGQGLAIARSVVVDKHGGRIRCESEPGRGTRFVVELPLAGEPARRPALRT